MALYVEKETGSSLIEGWVFENQQYELTLNTGIDLTAETDNVRFEITDPAGTVTTVTPSIVSPATGGFLKHTFAVDELNLVGLWQIRSELIAQKAPGRIFWLRVMPKAEEANIPAVLEMREFLEGYCTTEAVLSNNWWVKERDNFIVPWIEAKVGQPIGIATVQDKTEYVSGTGSRLLVLSRRPIVALKSLTYTNVQSSQYIINVNSVVVIAEEGILRSKSDFNEGLLNPLFARGKRNIKVVYSYGYVNIPPLLRHSIICLTCERALGQIGSRTGGGSISVQGYGRNYGPRGKWDNIRNEIAREGLSALRSFLTGTVGNV